MSIKLVSQKDVLVKSSYKEIREKTKDQDYKTYSAKQNIKQGYTDLVKDFVEYNDILNCVIRDVYETIVWEEWEIEKKNVYQYKQKRLYPRYRKDKDFKEDLRYDCLEKWGYSAHWINSVVDTAYSILDSWKKNYDKGKRKRNCPVTKRLFVRIKQTLMKIEKINFE